MKTIFARCGQMRYKSFFTICCLLIATMICSSSAVCLSRAASGEDGSAADEKKLSVPQRKLYIVIDAHENLSAQYDIARQLNGLCSSEDVYAIYLEGASGPVEPESYFAVSSDPEITQTASEFLLRKGFLTGSEYFKMLSGCSVPLRGVESPGDYTANLSFLKELKALNAHVPLRELLDVFNDCTAETFDPELVSVDSMYVKMVLQELSLLDFIDALIVAFSLEIFSNPDSYPVLHHLQAVSSYAPVIRLNLVRQLDAIEQQTADDVVQISELKTAITRNCTDYRVIDEAYTLLKRYESVCEPGVLHTVAGFHGHLKYIADLSPEQMYMSVIASYRKLAEGNGVPAGLFSARDSVIGLYKGSLLRLTPYECSYFGLEDISVEAYVALLVEHAVSPGDMIDTLFSTDSMAIIERARSAICSFYGSVEHRNRSIAANVLHDLPEGKTGIVVIGGYHRGIGPVLSGYGVQVVNLQPQITDSRNIERQVTYAEYLSGIVTSLEKMIYYAWSTIIAPLVSQSLAHVSTRKNAIPPVVARQLAVMIGATLTIQDSLQSDATPDEVISTVKRFFDDAEKANRQLTEVFEQLSGTEHIPQWPRIDDFLPVADNNGVFVTFRIGEQKLGLQLTKTGHDITRDEAHIIESLASDYGMRDAITFKGDSYDLRLLYITRSLQDKTLVDAVQSTPVNHYFKGNPVTRRRYFSAEEIKNQIVSWTHQPFEAKMALQVAEFKKNLSVARDRLKDQLHAELRPADPSFDGNISAFMNILDSMYSELENLSEPVDHLTFNVPGVSRPITLYLTSQSDLDSLHLNSFTMPLRNRIAIYLSAELLHRPRRSLGGYVREKIDRLLEFSTPVPDTNAVFFQTLKHELDIHLFRTPQPLAAVLEPLLDASGRESLGEASNRIIYQFTRRILKAKETHDEQTLYELHSFFNDYIRLEPDMIRDLYDDTALTPSEKKYAEKVIRDIARKAVFFRTNLEHYITYFGSDLREFQIHKKLGAGGFGTVYLAQKNNRLWAVKLTHKLDFVSLTFNKWVYFIERTTKSILSLGRTQSPSEEIRKPGVISRMIERWKNRTESFLVKLRYYLKKQKDPLWEINVRKAPDLNELISNRVMNITEASLNELIYANTYKGDNRPFHQQANWFFAIPYWPGNTLKSKTEDFSKQPLADTVEVLLAIIKECMKYEKLGVVHNDLHPGNIFIKESDGPRSRISIIDFGLSMRPDEPPLKYTDFFFQINNRYASTEFNTFFDVAATYSNFMKKLAAMSIDEVRESHIDKLMFIISRAQGLARDTKLLERLEGEFIPRIYKRFRNNEFVSTNEIILMIDQPMLRYIYSMIDQRSDIYSLGVVLMIDMKDQVAKSPELKRIMEKARAPKRDDRYANFQEMYDDLLVYAQNLDVPNLETVDPELTDISSDIAAGAYLANYVEGSAIQVKEAVESWEKQPVSKSLARNVRHYAASIAQTTVYFGQNRDQLPPEIAEQYHGSLNRFIAILGQLESALLQSKKAQKQITLEIPGQPRALVISLVTRGQLEKFGVSALTLPYDDRVEMYLPYELIAGTRSDTLRDKIGRFFSSQPQMPHELDVFFQLFKFELDTAVFNRQPLVSLAEESLLDFDSMHTPAQVSRRMYREFQRRYDAACKAMDLNSLYDMHAYLSSVIEQYSRFAVPDTLDGIIRPQVHRLIDDIVVTSKFFKLRAEHAIAEFNGELFGFTFIKPLYQRRDATVYLARKEGTLWRVIVPVFADKYDLEQSSEVGYIEQAAVQHMYHDAILAARVTGEDLVFALPYQRGETLADMQSYITTMEESALAELALAVARELAHIEEAGIVHNNIKAENIFVKPPLYDGSRIRILNFHRAFQYDEPLDRHTELFHDPLLPYATPELREYHHALDGYLQIIHMLDDRPLSQIDPSIIDTIIGLIANFEGSILDKTVYERTVNMLLPDISQQMREDQFVSAAELITEIDKAVVPVLVSMVDARSDMFLFGLLLQKSMFYHITTPEPSINRIIDKLLALDRADRYESFEQVVQELQGYLRRVMAAREALHKGITSKVLSTQWVGIPHAAMPSVTVDDVASWDTIPFAGDMAQQVQEYHATLEQSLEQIHAIIQENLAPENSEYDANITLFHNLVGQLARKLGALSAPAESITLDVAGDERPVHVHLVAHEHLREIHSMACTVPQGDRIDVYLPADYANPDLTGLLFQTFKHELDHNILGMPRTRAVLLESLLDPDDSRGLGHISRRIDMDFYASVQYAYETRNLSMLYRLEDYFTDLIENEQEAVFAIGVNTDLSDAEKTVAVSLARGLSSTADKYRTQIEHHIAELGGELYGFSFKRKLGSGNFSTVYLAEQNGRLWAVKIFKKYRQFEENEQIVTKAVYHDTYLDVDGSIGTGKGRFIAVPYFEGKTLQDHIDDQSLPGDEKTLLEMSLSLIEVFMKMENMGVMYNDLKPENVFVRSDREMRLLDFGCSVRREAIPQSLRDLMFGVAPEYASPEIMNFSMYMSVIEGLFHRSIDDVDDDFFQELTWMLKKESRETNDWDFYWHLMNTTVPAIQKKMEDGGYTDIESLRSELEPHIIRYFFTILDHQADLYSLGVIIKSDLLAPVMNEQLFEIVSKATVPNRERRYRTFKDLHRDLRAYYENLYGVSDDRQHKHQKPAVLAKPSVKAPSFATIRHAVKARLRKDGILEQDIGELFELSSDQHISGELDTLLLPSDFTRKIVHTILLEEYVRRSFSMVIDHVGAEYLFDQLFASITRQTGSIDKARTSFNLMKRIFGNHFDTSFEYDRTGDIQFTDQLLIEYLFSQFGGRNKDLFTQPAFAELGYHLANMFNDYDSELFDMLVFESDEIAHTGEYRNDRIEFVKRILMLAESMHEPDGTDPVVESPSQEQIVPLPKPDRSRELIATSL